MWFFTIKKTLLKKEENKFNDALNMKLLIWKEISKYRTLEKEDKLDLSKTHNIKI